MAAMPVARIHGIGPVTARRMSAMGIVTGADLRSRDLPFLQKPVDDVALAHVEKHLRMFASALDLLALDALLAGQLPE